jgi:putative hemolysin
MDASIPIIIHPFPWGDVAILVALVAFNGVFSMSELAIVSARKARLEAVSKKSQRRGAQTALALAADPGRFISTVQTGITLTAIISGAFSGASLGGPVAERLHALGLSTETAETTGFALVVGITTFISLVVGEIVPKQIALRSPEPIAIFMSVPMLWLSKATAPFVWLLDRTSALIFRILRMNRESESHVTAEELHLIVAEASKSGVIEESERAIISGVVRLADRPVREVMTPRTEVDWVDADADDAGIRAAILATPHSRMPVAEGSVDKIIGVVQARDIVVALLAGGKIDLRALLRAAPIIPDQVDAMDALQVLRKSEVPIAFVHDEYGHLEGIVTPVDLLSAIAGDFASDTDSDGEPALLVRDDGSFLISGWMPADALAERLGLTLEGDRDYATVAGFVLEQMKRLPQTGEHFDCQHYRFEVIDMDGRKIDKILAQLLES